MTADTAGLISRLDAMNPLREPVLRQAVAALQLEPSTRGLDVGCGIGHQALLLAEAAGPDCHVVGLDISAPVLEHAHQQVRRAPSHNRIVLIQGDMRCLPFADDSFDLVCSTDCLGYPAADSLPLLREVARVARRGAKVALLAWTSQSLLPGHAMLEARLNADASAYAPYLGGSTPESHFMRLGRWLSEVGIGTVKCQSFLGEVRAPLDEGQRTALGLLIDMLWGAYQTDISHADRLAYSRLCRLDSPDCILDLPDYYGFFTYTMFAGLVEKP